MPTYVYRCEECGTDEERQRSVIDRDEPCLCSDCDELMRRVFMPTALIHVHAHFRVLQSDVLPDKEDHAAWEARSSNSQYRPTSEKKETLADHMEREMVQMGDHFWQPMNG